MNFLKLGDIECETKIFVKKTEVNYLSIEKLEEGACVRL